MKFTDRGDGVRLAWTLVEGASPTVVFLPGLGSDMTGEKASHLALYLAARGNAFLRLDYSGHGKSDGRFEEGTISRWRDDALTVIDRAAPGPVVLVGSSMGGWISLLIAQMRPRVTGVVTVALGADFTETHMWGRFSPELRRELMKRGSVVVPTPFHEQTVVTRDFIEDGRHNLLLDGPIEVDCPVRLLHGQRDGDIPWQVSVEAAGLLRSEDVRVVLTKDGDHRLSRPRDIEVLVVSVEELLRRQDSA
jgi:pimeloyl-ACP methyl ester carboxylesterase